MNAFQQAKDAASGFLQRFNVPQQLGAIPSWISNTYQMKQDFLPKAGFKFAGQDQRNQIDKSLIPGTAQYKMMYGEGYAPRTSKSAQMAGPLLGNISANARPNTAPREIRQETSMPFPSPSTNSVPPVKNVGSPIADRPIKKMFPVASISPTLKPNPSMKDKPWAKAVEPDQKLIQEIQKGYEKYKASQGVKGSLPASNVAPVFAEFAQRYPMFQNNPYLMPAVAIHETSGGLNITRPNNLINYGVRSPVIKRLFNQPDMDMEEALRRSLYEMAQQGSPYSKFNTGEPLTREQLMEFAKTYEPANPSYFAGLSGSLRDYWGLPY